MCGLAPREVDEMGWFDLARFTLLVDDENEDVKRRLARMRAQQAPTGQMQRL